MLKRIRELDRLPLWKLIILATVFGWTVGGTIAIVESIIDHTIEQIQLQEIKRKWGR